MTTAERNNNTVSALDIYSAYPHGDLLPVEPPDKNMSVRDFLKQVDPPTLGDTLFLFILREVADLDGERAEVIRALNRAIDDLAAVVQAASDKAIDVEVTREQYQRISLNEPKPTDIKLFVKEGELYSAADIKTTGQLMEQVARLMDKSCVYDIAGDVLFQTANGKFYTVHIEADVVEQDASEVEIVLDEQLDWLDGNNEMDLPENMTADERIHVKLEALLRNRMDQAD